MGYGDRVAIVGPEAAQDLLALAAAAARLQDEP